MKPDFISQSWLQRSKGVPINDREFRLFLHWNGVSDTAIYPEHHLDKKHAARI